MSTLLARPGAPADPPAPPRGHRGRQAPHLHRPVVLALVGAACSSTEWADSGRPPRCGSPPRPVSRCPLSAMRCYGDDRRRPPVRQLRQRRGGSPVHGLRGHDHLHLHSSTRLRSAVACSSATSPSPTGRSSRLHAHPEPGRETGAGPATDLRVSAVTVNTGSGITIGGVDGAPDSAVAVSPTSNPFSLRSQTFTAGQEPQYVDARVVEGQLGRPGAVIELTAQVDAERMADPTAAPVPMQVSVRLRDVAGVGQSGMARRGSSPSGSSPTSARRSPAPTAVRWPTT